MYDSRIGRWFARDPLAEKFPNISPYVYCLNNPLNFINPDGRDPIDVIKRLNAFTNKTFNKAWKDSFINDGEKVQEITFVIIRSRKGIMRTGDIETLGSSGGRGKPIVLNAGEKIVGQGHTHPYSISEGSHQGIPFSGTDIFGVKGRDKDYVSMVEAGTKRFALIIENKKMADAFFKGKSMSDINEQFNLNLKAANGTGTFEERAKTAIINTLGKDSGIGFYESTNKEDFSKVELPEKKVEATPTPLTPIGN